jgi:hypothetical protein
MKTTIFFRDVMLWTRSTLQEPAACLQSLRENKLVGCKAYPNKTAGFVQQHTATTYVHDTISSTKCSHSVLLQFPYNTFQYYSAIYTKVKGNVTPKQAYVALRGPGG